MSTIFQGMNYWIVCPIAFVGIAVMVIGLFGTMLNVRYSRGRAIKWFLMSCLGFVVLALGFGYFTSAPVNQQLKSAIEQTYPVQVTSDITFQNSQNPSLTKGSLEQFIAEYQGKPQSCSFNVTNVESVSHSFFSRFAPYKVDGTLYCNNTTIMPKK